MSAFAHKEDIAIQHNSVQLSYKQLIYHVNNASELLINRGISKGDYVTVLMPPSIGFVVSVLSILKVGAVCVPINIQNPIERVEYIVKSSNAKLVITCDDFEEQVNNCHTLVLQEDIYVNSEVTVHDINDELCVEFPKSHPVFCIFTSGSTATPKGIVLSQKGVMNHLYEKIKLLNIKKENTICLSMNIGFVASIWQLLAPLVLGAKLLILDSSIISNTYKLFVEAETHNVRVVAIIPRMLKVFLDYVNPQRREYAFNNIEYIILTGEDVDELTVNRFYSLFGNVQLVNAYGLTETSDDIFHYKIPINTNHKYIPIGSPIKNITFSLEPDGELIIQGDCLPRKYIGDGKLFKIINGHRAICTNDIFITKTNSDLVYSGRKNNQIKIKGYRINPTEIENAIKQVDGIIDCVVSKNNTGNLISIYTATNKIESCVFLEHLQTLLPNYMIPKKYIWSNEMALSSNGKPDRRAINLLMTELDNVSNRFVEQLKKTLETDQCDIQDEISFDSILFISFIVALEGEFDISWEDEMLLFDAFIKYQDMLDYVYSRLLVKESIINSGGMST